LACKFLPFVLLTSFERLYPAKIKKFVNYLIYRLLVFSGDGGTDFIMNKIEKTAPTGKYQPWPKLTA